MKIIAFEDYDNHFCILIIFILPHPTPHRPASIFHSRSFASSFFFFLKYGQTKLCCQNICIYVVFNYSVTYSPATTLLEKHFHPIPAAQNWLRGTDRI